MERSGEGFAFEVLVELVASHDAQSLDGTPVTRIVARDERCLELATMAGLEDLTLNLDRREFGWLCSAMDFDRLSPAAARLSIGGVPVRRAAVHDESHVRGHIDDITECAFPVYADPTATAGFVTYVASDDDKAQLLERLRTSGSQTALHVIGGGGTVH